ncbi:Kelch repeat-containing protein [Pseudomonas aeruginosa]
MNRLVGQALLAIALAIGSGGASAQVSPELAGSFRWSQASAASLARQEIYPAVLNGKIYVAGGVLTPPTGYSAHFEVYDAQADRWSELTPIPEARHHIGLAEAGGLIYGVGGFAGGFPFWRAQSSVFVYDPRTNQWSTAPSLPEARAEGVAVSVDGRIFAIGGRVASKPGAAHFNDHADSVRGDVLDPASGRWSPIADAPTARNSAAAAVIGGKIYVVGGRQAFKQPDGSLRQVNVATLEVYDPGSNRWQSKAPMPQAQGGLAAAAHDGRLYVFGGEQWVPEQKVLAESWVYDPSSDSWSALPPLPTPRHGLGAAAVGNRIFVMGGGARVGGGEATRAHEVLEISSR